MSSAPVIPSFKLEYRHKLLEFLPFLNHTLSKLKCNGDHEEWNQVKNFLGVISSLSLDEELRRSVLAQDLFKLSIYYNPDMNILD